MKKHSGKHRADGGALSSASALTKRYPVHGRAPLGGALLSSYKTGGSVTAKQLAEGKAGGVRSGSRSNMAPERLDRGFAEAKRKGTNAKALSMGKPGGRRRYAEGGHATDMDFETKGERLKKTRARNDTLGNPHYSFGGEISQTPFVTARNPTSRRAPPGKKLFKSQSFETREGPSSRSPFAEGGKVHKGMKALYHALHSHFENEPQMKKLKATKAKLYEGEPHRFAEGGPTVRNSSMKIFSIPKAQLPLDLPKRSQLTETYKKYRPQ